MGLVTRISRLVRADAHYLLDCIEEPGVLVKQALREMEEEIAADEERMKNMVRSEKALQAQIDQAQHTLTEAQEQIEASFKNREETLARAFVRKRLATTKLNAQLQRELEMLAERQRELRRSLEERRAKKAEIAEKATLYEAAKAAEEQQRLDRTLHAPVFVSDEDVELEFLEEKRKREVEVRP